jgi:hypothetical protein
VRDVTDPKPWLKAAALVKAVHSGIFAATLQEDVTTIFGPSCGKRRLNNGPSVTAPPKFGVRDHIFQKSVPPAGTQEIWRCDEHTGGNNLAVDSRYEDCKVFVGQYLQPDLFGFLFRLNT